MPGVGVTGLQYKSPGLGVADSIYYGRLNFSKCFDLVGIGKSSDIGIYSDVFDQIILAETTSNIDNLLYILKRHNIAGIIPNRDEEVEVFSEIAHLLDAMNISAFIPEIKYVRIVNDKHLFYTYLHENGYTTPKLYDARDAHDFLDKIHLSFPVVIKGRKKGVYLARDNSEFRAGISYIKKIDGDVLIQQFISGISISVAGFVAGDVTLLLGIRKLIIDADGTTLACVTIYNSDLMSITLDLLYNLKWRGAFEIEFLYDPVKNKYYIIEMNSRYPFWIGICKYINYNIPFIHSLMLLGYDDLEYIDNLNEYDTGRIFYLGCRFSELNFKNTKKIH